MGNKEGSPSAAGEAKSEKKGDLNILWFIGAACLLSAGFFSLSAWMTTPKEKIVQCRSHLCPKSTPIPRMQRQPNGYKVAY